MKSLANWAEELQGWDGGRSGRDSSSGRPCASSSSPSPNPSAAVKASRSGDPIIFDPCWDGGALVYTPSAEADIAGAAARTVGRPPPGPPASVLPVSQLFTDRTPQQRAELQSFPVDAQMSMVWSVRRDGSDRLRQQHKQAADLIRERKVPCGQQSQG